MCAGISAILLVFISLIFTAVNVVFHSVAINIISYVVYAILSSYYFYGFYYLGRKYKNNLLSVMSVIGAVSIVLIYLAMIIGGGTFESKFDQFNQTVSQQEAVLNNLIATNASTEQIAVVQGAMGKSFIEFFGTYLVYLMVFLFVWLIGAVLFDVALIKLKKVEYARVTGIIGLVSIGLALSVFGIFLAVPLMIAYSVMLIVILFSQAKKFKEIR